MLAQPVSVNTNKRPPVLSIAALIKFRSRSVHPVNDVAAMLDGKRAPWDKIEMDLAMGELTSNAI